MKKELLKLIGVYETLGEHTISENSDRVSTESSQVVVDYTCVECGEEHKTKDAFSPVCDGEYNTGGFESNPVDVLVSKVTDRYIRLRLYTHDPPNTIHIRVNHPDHSREVRQTVTAVEEQETLKVTLVSDNAERTSWHIGEIRA